MDWFHCNQCFRKDGAHFFVTSCGHIFCKKCVTLEKCAVCGTACKHLALSDNLKPQEKMFFKSPVETALQYFSHISQVWSFQKKQTDLLIAFYKHRITKLETAMQEAQQALVSQDKELSVLRKENGELKKFLAILKESPSRYQGSRSITPRPVGITSPSQSVTPRPSFQHSSQVVSRSSSAESIPYREAGFGSLGQGGRGLQGRRTPRDSYNETPSPASTHSLSYRTSSASSGQGIFSFRPSPNGHSGHTRVLTPNNFAQRESTTTLESLPSFQLPVLQTLYQQRRHMGLPSGREAWTTSR
ncbi:ring finger protein 212B [Homo sapiens]|uniref:E3 ubiquitin-protein ligase RNF212B n=1 Tax=Homo sapiens TaxID=9606 RepID=R212B_HUMAN|nr:RING finger protein 212B [Homo sapiens]NP_001357147.1 RING finger protein 212B [Homo sapiens]A8MTL3.1 RecName: Full=RING finger protein 212B [Homo sapiens]EAW66180.1 hCG1815045, isoform CRA_b [Homo sapiens]KAI2570465.1 ring finger protein 212B [Homo sapiens]KAI2570466.1 ring finger protein 212B [Homo sapiens]KAI4060106.1 ring finger protein 212B [Homo sapiens]KAI4060108.1 ring finger protein 212B [Homo sapiens]|eukprot:NP_001269251.1 RING finger protein 212B [Homo sapiens]